ncbi:endonuclease/exonuclease/phosphatase family protein, partial [Cooperia oncophora]
MPHVAARQGNKRKDSIGDPVGNSSAKRPDLDVEREDFHPEDLSKFSAKEILYAIQQRNKDPIIDQMLEALVTKLPQEISEGIDAEKRARSLVISGLPEAPVDMRPSARQDDLESKVCKLLDILRVECRPLEIYRLGKLADSRPRLVKLVLPSRSHWATALSNSRLLRDSEFANVYIRKSMTPAERKRDYELRTECKERNKRANARVWVWETSKQPWFSKGISCLLFNSRSLSNKIHHLHLLLSTDEPDLLFITETWLSTRISSSEIIGGFPYQIFRRDRKGRKGGGVCCLAKNGLKISLGTVPPDIKSDLLCLDITDSIFSRKIRVILVYRPPNSSANDDDCLIESLLDVTLTQAHLVLLGDLNLEIDWSTNTAKSSGSSKFLEFFKAGGFTQNVMEPTRGESILDIILTSTPLLRSVSIKPPFASSDHSTVAFQFQIQSPLKNNLPFPNFNKADYGGLSSYLNSVNWWEVFCDYTSVDDVYNRFCGVVHSGLSRFVPLQSPQMHKHRYPKHLLNLMSQKTRLFHTLPSALTDPVYKNYFDDSAKAEALAQYFTSVFVPQSIPLDEVSPLRNTFDSLSEISIDPLDVLRVLKSLKCSTALTIDGIPQI